MSSEYIKSRRECCQMVSQFTCDCGTHIPRLGDNDPFVRPPSTRPLPTRRVEASESLLCLPTSPSLAHMRLTSCKRGFCPITELLQRSIVVSCLCSCSRYTVIAGGAGKCGLFCLLAHVPITLHVTSNSTLWKPSTQRCTSWGPPRTRWRRCQQRIQSP